MEVNVGRSEVVGCLGGGGGVRCGGDEVHMHNYLTSLPGLD